MKRAEQYYKENFEKDYNLIKDIRSEPLITFDTMLKFAAMYKLETSKAMPPINLFASKAVDNRMILAPCCPICEHKLGELSDTFPLPKYCPECGQKIKPHE